eukprot:8642374-Alexandrium_andersonii.AAC.1
MLSAGGALPACLFICTSVAMPGAPLYPASSDISFSKVRFDLVQARTLASPSAPKHLLYNGPYTSVGPEGSRSVMESSHPLAMA